MFEPRVVGFFCKWCTYAGADLAGTSRKQYPPNGVAVRVNCSGRVDPQHILWAFREGADGVLLGGCHPGDCHYQDGNYNTMRRLSLLKPMLKELGIDPDRVRLEWISAAEGDKLVRVMNEFVDAIRELGPMTIDLGEKLSGVEAPPDVKDIKVAKKPATVAKKTGAAKKAAPKPKPEASASKSKRK
jgi:F420-non-reducing hydrogenase iron-sulfur subunit